MDGYGAELRQAAFRLVCGLVMTSAVFAVPAFSSAHQSVQPVRVPPSKGAERPPAERLELAVRNLFDLLARPDPKYEPFVHFSEATRVSLVITQPGGLADAEMVEGESARRFLAGMFGPESGVSFSFGPPRVEVDGAFGRARLGITAREMSKSPECGFAYVDAVLTPPGGWAKTANQGLWRLTHITLSFEKLRRCP